MYPSSVYSITERSKMIRMTQAAKGKKRQKSQGYVAAASARQFPSPSRHEVAFAGRSNVGKSTLINALSKRKNLARTSKTPGKTRLVFFYETERDDLYFVDLPGYGYAKASRDEMTSFSRVTDDYFKSGRPIGVVLLLIDIRRGFGDLDLQMLDYLCHFNIAWQVVLTKADKLSRQAIVKAEREAMLTIEKYAAQYGHKSYTPISVSAGPSPGDAAVKSLERRIYNIVDGIE